MRIPTVFLEKKKLPRVMFSIQVSSSSGAQEISSLMRKIYEMGIWCFDLPYAKHLEAFKELKILTEDRDLTGLVHLEAEEGASLLGKPLHRFESIVLSTIRRNLSLPDSIRSLPPSFASEVFTQKEIDRITFDPLRFDRGLALFDPEETPFLLVGETYGDWLLALGRIDLLRVMVSRVREKGFLPIFSGQWTTFVLPKAKSLDVAAYAVPINPKWGPSDLQQAADLIKKFDKPVIVLNPLADAKLLKEPEGVFSYLLGELKVCALIVKIASEGDAGRILEALKKFPSLIPPRKT
jgi:hypothetical protein